MPIEIELPTTTFTWAAFRRAEITRTDVVLLLNRGFLGIPLDGLRPADQERLVGLMTAHRLLDAPR